MDQNYWFNSGAPAPQSERQAFEAGWTAAQKQMAFSQPQISERIFQNQQNIIPSRPSYLPGRLIGTPEDIRPNEIPMDGTIAVFPSLDYSYVVLKAWNSNGSIQTEIYRHESSGEPTDKDVKLEEFKMDLTERLERIEKMLTSVQLSPKTVSEEVLADE